MADEAKTPSWLQFIKIFPWFLAVAAAAFAGGTWRTHQETALQSLSDQVQLLNTKINQVDQNQRDTSNKVSGLSERVDAVRETLFEQRKR